MAIFRNLCVRFGKITVFGRALIKDKVSIIECKSDTFIIVEDASRFPGMNNRLRAGFEGMFARKWVLWLFHLCQHTWKGKPLLEDVNHDFRRHSGACAGN